eukprot:14318374-Ditylum_brightwellii.AAC.1
MFTGTSQVTFWAGKRYSTGIKTARKRDRVHGRRTSGSSTKTRESKNRRDSTDVYTKDFLQELQHKQSDLPKVQTEFDWKDMRNGFKMWKENTATSPLGRYLGKYKAWIRKEKTEEKEIEDGSEIPQKTFFQTITNVLKTT